MAHSLTKARLFNELSRSRTNSPYEDDFATAGSFDMRNDQIINSTIQIADDTTQQPLPLHYSQHPDYEPSESGSDGSADMSIELGRGVKRGARDADDDVSSNLIFNMGNDSQYEITGTPPIRPRPSARKSNDALRREASIRRATETAKSNVAMQRTASRAKHRTLSEGLVQINADTKTSFVDDPMQHTATFTSRNTRFTRPRQVSANEQSHMPSRFTAGQSREGTPHRPAANNPTMQSATFTANSFLLPDLPNITELVSGVRKDGTPVFNRTTSKPRSRFTSASYKPHQPQHEPVESVAVPDEEKAIYTSLQLLKDKVAELEMAKSEAQKRAEEYEDEIIDLRSLLQMERRRPDSALGSDEESRAQEKRRMEKTRLQASIKALQDRLDRSERKISVSDIAVKRVTKERDELVTQIGVAYFNNEEIKGENEALRNGHDKMQAETDGLRDDLETVRRENQELRQQLARFQAKKGEDAAQWKRREPGTQGRLLKHFEKDYEMRDIAVARDVEETKEHRLEKPEASVRSKKEGKTQRAGERAARRTSSTLVGRETEEDIASRISREVQKHREEAIAIQRRARQQEEADRGVKRQTSVRPQQRQQMAGAERPSAAKEHVFSAQDPDDLSEAESTTELKLPQNIRNAVDTLQVPSSMHGKPQEDEDDDGRDYTELTVIDTDELDKLRRKLEWERFQEKQKRNVSAPVSTSHDETRRSVSFGLPRKSSLKDMTAGFGDGAGRFSLLGENVEEAAKAARTVRVQSPHASEGLCHDLGDLSVLSNTSRRRRRAASADGLTSAFILPDITLHSRHQLPTTTGKACIQHNASSCTVCHPTKDITIPTPIPVTDRDLPQDMDITTATVRPSQPPPLALATVIKQVEDEIVHLKLQLQHKQQMYNQHNPALSKRKRADIRLSIDRLTAEIEKRSDQVYALYDVLEGQKQAAAQAHQAGEQAPAEMREDEVEETLMSIGIDPAELSGRIGRAAPPVGLDGAGDVISSGEESEGLPWEGLSDYESEEEERFVVGARNGREKRRSVGF